LFVIALVSEIRSGFESFSEAELLVEGGGGFDGGGAGGFVEVVGDFEDAGNVGRQCGDVTGYIGPVDVACAGPEVVVLGAVVVVEVELGDAGFEELEGSVDAYVLFRRGEVGVAEVEADTYVVEVAYTDDLEEMLGGGDLVLEVFEEDADAEGMGEGFEVLDGSEGVLERTGVPEVVLVAEVEDDGLDGELLGGFEGALDLVHGVDAAGLFGVDEVEIGGYVAGPLSVGAVAGVDRLVKGGGDFVGAKPGGDVADGGAVGVVEVVAGGEDLDGLGSAVMKGVEQAGVQALLKEDVGR
jgi:hypothetical protein